MSDKSGVGTVNFKDRIHRKMCDRWRTTKAMLGSRADLYSDSKVLDLVLPALPGHLKGGQRVSEEERSSKSWDDSKTSTSSSLKTFREYAYLPPFGKRIKEWFLGELFENGFSIDQKGLGRLVDNVGTEADPCNMNEFIVRRIGEAYVTQGTPSVLVELVHSATEKTKNIRPELLTVKQAIETTSVVWRSFERSEVINRQTAIVRGSERTVLVVLEYNVDIVDGEDFFVSVTEKRWRVLRLTLAPQEKLGPDQDPGGMYYQSAVYKMTKTKGRNRAGEFQLEGEVAWPKQRGKLMEEIPFECDYDAEMPLESVVDVLVGAFKSSAMLERSSLLVSHPFLTFWGVKPSELGVARKTNDGAPRKVGGVQTVKVRLGSDRVYAFAEASGHADMVSADEKSMSTPFKLFQQKIKDLVLVVGDVMNSDPRRAVEAEGTHKFRRRTSKNRVQLMADDVTQSVNRLVEWSKPWIVESINPTFEGRLDITERVDVTPEEALEILELQTAVGHDGERLFSDVDIQRMLKGGPVMPVDRTAEDIEKDLEAEDSDDELTEKKPAETDEGDSR